MKNLDRLLLLTLLAVSLLSCNKKLEKENHSRLTPEFFQTAQGFETGLNAAYSGLRELYGPEEGVEAFTAVGTDEFRTANGNRTSNVANYSSAYLSSNEFSSKIWNTCYTYINTCNGLIKFGADITELSEDAKKQKLAEAHFLRAFYYFTLVPLFGDVTLNTEFQDAPTTAAERADKGTVYDLIEADLKVAMDGLVASSKIGGVQPGRATAATARHLLAKVYLTRAYTDIAKSDDFQQALNLAKGLIDDAPALNIGLLPDFEDVHRPTNEDNAEVLFSVQYSTDLVFGGEQTWNHLYVNKYDVQLGERNLNDGRCYAWFRGTDWLYNTAFADKTNDSRYYKTFQSVWYATRALSGSYTIKVDGQTHTLNYNFQPGDTAMVMPGYNMPLPEMQNKNYYIFTPENYTDATIFPTMTKYLDPNRETPNENGKRPIIVLRLADTYLVAAEAAYQLGQPDLAAQYINVIRKRAANEGREQAMEVNAADIDIDFILDERSRELCAENFRWLDLVRTGKLFERVRAFDDFEARNNIREYHVIRPIPQSQIDAVITGPPYPQNPGWN